MSIRNLIHIFRKEKQVYTSKQLYHTLTQSGFGKDTTKPQALRHYDKLLSLLEDDEIITMTFIGIDHYEPEESYNGNYTYILTNKRLLGCHLGYPGEDKVELPISDIQTISHSSDMLMGIIRINETYLIGVDKDLLEDIYREIKEAVTN